MIGLFCAGDSTKVKPNFRYKKMVKNLDSADIKLEMIKLKIDSLNNKRRK